MNTDGDDGAHGVTRPTLLGGQDERIGGRTSKCVQVRPTGNPVRPSSSDYDAEGRAVGSTGGRLAMARHATWRRDAAGTRSRDGCATASARRALPCWVVKTSELGDGVQVRPSASNRNSGSSAFAGPAEDRGGGDELAEQCSALRFFKALAGVRESCHVLRRTQIALLLA
jgi:hypothetical protein